MTPASVLPPRCGYPQDDCIKQLPGRLELSPVRVAPGGVIAVDALATVSHVVHPAGCVGVTPRRRPYAPLNRRFR